MGLLNIYGNYTRLEKKYAYILHSIVAKLLWVEKGGSLDIETTILFLCISVTKSTKEKKEKLRRVLQYLKNTINDKIIMGADRLRQLLTLFNSADGVHPSLKIHTGSCISFGYGMVHLKV